MEHMAEHEADTVGLDALRDQMVAAALPHVPFDGWTIQALKVAAVDMGVDATMPERLFPGGVIEAVVHFVRMADQMMIEDASSVITDDMGDRARVAAVIKLRFDRWDSHREAIRRAAGLLALPTNLPIAAGLAWGTAAAIWQAAGKSSHDFSWYTQRASLAAVYGATMAVWLGDSSENCQATYAFLARRLDNVVEAIKLRRRAATWLERLIPERLLPPA